MQNVCASQNYVSEFALNDYPLTEADILHKGKEAFYAALNTVNIGKYNLGWASIGICTHALYEAVAHAHNRKLYDMRVTDFPHVKRMFVDAYARLVAMKLFALRACDYMRSASADDRRYLLYNPMVKMKVTTEGERVINLLWDVIAAKGFEKSTYFEQAAVDIRGLPKLEGTVHVNIALIVKFMPNFFFAPADLPEVPRRDDAANDDFLFDQGPARGLGGIRFHDYRRAFAAFDLPNVKVFAGQVEAFRAMLASRAAERRAEQGHRLPARGRRAVRAGGLRAADPRERAHLRRRARSGRPDLRLPGARLRRVRAAAAQQGEQHARADAALPRDDRQAGVRRAPLRRGVDRARAGARRRVRDECLRGGQARPHATPDARR